MKANKIDSLTQAKVRQLNVRRGRPGQLNAAKSLGGRGFAPDPTGGAYSAPPDHLAGGRGLAAPSPRTRIDATDPNISPILSEGLKFCMLLQTCGTRIRAKFCRPKPKGDDQVF